MGCQALNAKHCRGSSYVPADESCSAAVLVSQQLGPQLPVLILQTAAVGLHQPIPQQAIPAAPEDPWIAPDAQGRHRDDFYNIESAWESVCRILADVHVVL